MGAVGEPGFLISFLALFLGGLNLALWGTAVRGARRQRNRRLAMRRRAMIAYYPGAVGTGMDDDPYLRPWKRALEKIR